MPQEKLTLRQQILLPLTCMILLLTAGFIISVYKIKHNQINALLNRQHNIARAGYSEIVDNKTNLMAAASQALQSDPVITHALMNNNRDALLAHSRLYLRYLTSHEISQCYFHSANGVTLLRLHHLSMYGDPVKRHVFKQAAISGKPASGIELSPLGNMVLRLVVPWYHGESIVGYLELGIELSHILDRLSLLNDIEYLITIDKSLLDKERIDKGLAAFIGAERWENLPDRIITATSLEEIPPQLYQELTEIKNTPIEPDKEFRRIKLFKRHFAYKYIPFTESSGRIVGLSTLMYDITALNKSFFHLMLSAITLGSMAGISLFILAWQHLGRAQQLIDNSKQQLEEQLVTITDANQQLEQEMSVRRQAESDLALLNTKLELRIEERTRHLSQKQQELETAYTELKSRQAMIMHLDKMANIGLLASGVAHDINNPVGYIANNLEELQIYLERMQNYIQHQHEQLQTNSNQTVISQLNEIRSELGIDYIYDDFGTLIAESQDGIQRVCNIVRNLRNFSRVDDMDLRIADLHECLEGAIRITNHELRYKAVLKRNYGQIPSVLCRPQQLNQVFMNLLINAVHAIEKQGEIEISTSHDAENVYVEISDNGCGIPEELQTRIFEPFFTTKDNNTGTGLGLSIVAEIIQLHNGGIKVSSRPGEGTRFTITLPIKEQS